MRLGKINGWHIAFLSFAVLLLSVPAHREITSALGLSADWGRTWGRLLPLTVMGIAVAILYWRSPDTVLDLIPPFPSAVRGEVVAVFLMKIAIPFATIGGFVLWHLVSEGASALDARYVAIDDNKAASNAFSLSGVVIAVIVAPILAPIIEEIVFRGFLYRLWAERWGWFASMIMTSLLFGAYHQNFVSSFLGSVVYVCLYRRTGTLLAPMLLHSAFNLAVYYPFLGRFLLPPPGSAFGDITTWWLQLASLAFVVVALPIYVFMSRHERREGDFA